MKKVIINADDFALTDGICKSICDLFEKQAISSTSVMICIQGAEQRGKKFWRANYADFAGVHLQITAEKNHRKPLSPVHEISSLLDSQGRFKTRDTLHTFDPEHVEIEWERQICATAEALGQLPGHLDSHHGQHRDPRLLPVYINLAKKYSLPVRGGKEPGLFSSYNEKIVASDLCESDWTGKERPLSDLKQFIKRKLSHIGCEVLEVVTHPGYVDEELIRASDWNVVREHDHRRLLELAEENWVQEQGIELISFKNIQ